MSDELKIGDRVRFVGVSDESVKWGGNDDPRLDLVSNRYYTVRAIEVHSWHTKVILEEHPDKKYPSVGFTTVREAPYTLDQVLDDPHTHPDLKRGIRQIRAMGFEPEVARQEDLDQDQRRAWDAVHDAAGLPRRTDLVVPPAPIEVPPLVILVVMAKTVFQCQASYNVGKGLGDRELTQEHLDNLVDLIVRFIKNPKMEPIETFPGASTEDSTEIDIITLKAVRFALTLAGINL